MELSTILYAVVILPYIIELKFVATQFYYPVQYRRSDNNPLSPSSREILLDLYLLLKAASSYFQTLPNTSPFSDSRNSQRLPEIFQGFVRTSPINLNNDDINKDNQVSGRLLSASTFNKISETLGALNTVGQFFVDITRGQNSNESNEDDSDKENIPDAILTITKNVLGQNMTKKIEPLIKRVSKDEDTTNSPNILYQKKKKNGNKVKKDTQIHNVPVVPISTSPITVTSSVSQAAYDSTYEKESENRCKTPDGRPGRCEDLSSCPALLLDLSNLRESLCFKSLFVPGVCCPISQSTVLTTQRPLRLTTKPPAPKPTSVYSTTQTLILLPQIPITTTTTTTKRPLLHVPSYPSNNLSVPMNIVNSEDCGQQEYSSGRIVGGIESENGEWPWLAAIFLHGPKRTEFWCGGSLIGSKYILTAAHCTRDSRQKPFAARQFTVRLGDVDLSTDDEPSAPQTFRVKEVRAHERVGFYNDVAILVLDKPARKSKYVIPVCLPNKGVIQHRLAGKRATVVGWGTTYYGGKESTVQRQADLPIWRNDDCDRAYFQPITDNFLCAGYSEGGVDACQGDSGGPLMMKMDAKWIQLGIVSFGNKCGEPGYPGVYTRISEYTDWIKSHTKD